MSTPHNLDEEQAAIDARRKFLEQQALGFMNGVRMLKCQLMMATMAEELPPQFREYLYGELLHCAGIVEVKK